MKTKLFLFLFFISNLSIAQTATWKERGPNNIGGHTYCVLYDSFDKDAKKVWAGSGTGGLWYNNDITNQQSAWQQIPELGSQSITAMATNSSKNNILALASGLWQLNKGESVWKKINTISGSKMVISSDGTIFIANNGGLSRSDDGGITFSLLTTPFAGILISDLKIATDNILYVGLQKGKIYRSDDPKGSKWTDITIPNAEQGYSMIGLAPSTSGASQIIYSVIASSTNNALNRTIAKSIDAGRTWTQIPTPKSTEINKLYFSQPFRNFVLIVHPTNPDIVFAGGFELNRSLDGGQTWEVTFASSLYLHPDITDIKFNPQKPDELTISSDGGIYYMPNSKLPFTDLKGEKYNRNNNYRVTQYYKVAMRNIINDDFLMGGTQDNGNFVLNNTDIATAQQIGGGDGFVAYVDDNEPDIWIGSFFPGCNYYTIDRKQPFKIDPVYGKIVNNYKVLYSDASGNPNSVYDSQSNALYLYSTQDTKTLVRIVGVGTTNKVLKISLPTELEGAIPVQVGKKADVLFMYSDRTVTTYPALFKLTFSTEKDFTYTTINTSPLTRTSLTSSSLEIGKTDDELLYSDYNNYLYYTADGGKTWAKKNGIPNGGIYTFILNQENFKQVMAATNYNNTIIATDDITATTPVWKSVYGNLPPSVYFDQLKYRPADGLVALATFGRGIWTTDYWAKKDLPSVKTDAITLANCGKTSFSLSFTPNGTLASNTTYTAYLSDNQGNFIEDIIIGTNKVSPIAVTLPNGFKASAGDKYMVKVVATGSQTVMGSTALLNQITQPTISLDGKTEFCEGGSVTLKVESGYSYTWYKDNAVITTAKDASLSVKEAGAYSVVMSNGACEVQSSITNLTRTPLPTATLANDNPTIIKGESATLNFTFTSVSPWTIKLSDGQNLTVNSSPYKLTVTPSTTTTYAIQSVSNSCGIGSTNGTAVVSVQNPLANEPIQPEDLVFFVAPNPFSNQTTLQFYLPKKLKTDLKVYDVMGRTIDNLLNEVLQQGWHSVLFDGENLPQGVYYGVIYAEGMQKTVKMVLTK